MSIQIGFLHSLIRPEEKMLLKEFQSRNGVEVAMIAKQALLYLATDFASRWPSATVESWG